MRDKFAILTGRIAEVIQHYKISQRSLAGKIGISSAYLNQVLNGKGKPNVDILLGIAEVFPDINTDWLLTGKGDMLKGNSNTGQLASAIEDTPSEWRSLSDDADAKAFQLAKQLQLGRIAQLAEGATRHLAFRVLSILEIESKSLTGPELLTRMELEVGAKIGNQALNHELAFLLNKGLIQCLSMEGIDRYSLCSEEARLHTQASVEHASEHTLEAIRLLAKKVWTPLIEKQGGLIVANLQLPKREAKDVSKELLSLVQTRLGQASQNDGSGDTEVSLVVGVGLQVWKNVTTE